MHVFFNSPSPFFQSVGYVQFWATDVWVCPKFGYPQIVYWVIIHVPIRIVVLEYSPSSDIAIDVGYTRGSNFWSGSIEILWDSAVWFAACPPWSASANLDRGTMLLTRTRTSLLKQKRVKPVAIKVGDVTIPNAELTPEVGHWQRSIYTYNHLHIHRLDNQNQTNNIQRVWITICHAYLAP